MNAQWLAHPLNFGPQLWVPTLLKIVKPMGRRTWHGFLYDFTEGPCTWTGKHPLLAMKKGPLAAQALLCSPQTAVM
jgi:hypothetical protein